MVVLSKAEKAEDMKINLARNATLRTIVRGLKGPEEFVRAVFANMAGYSRDCQVRLALDGKPQNPDYQIEFFIQDEVDGEEVDIPQTAAIFTGRNHREIAYVGNDLDRPWSSEAMRYEAVQALLGELRGIAAKP